jgi:hypothetical protein
VAPRRLENGRPKDVDVFKPYDGYAPIAQFFLDAFQLHGVKRGDAFAFCAGDIRVEGPHLRGTAGARQVTVRAETALGAFTTPSSGGWIMFGKPRAERL